MLDRIAEFFLKTAEKTISPSLGELLQDPSWKFARHPKIN
jgi:hypothetical protein